MAETAIGIVFDEAERVLLVKRRDVPVWVLPGGGIDEGETPEDATVREVAEETGVSVEITRKTAEYAPGGKLTLPVHVFACEVKEGVPHATSETLDAAFFALDQLPPLFFHIHREWVEDAINHPEEIVRRPLKGITLWPLFKRYWQHPQVMVRAFLAQVGLPINS